MPKSRIAINGNGICFNSSLLPPYLNHAKIIEELLPWLYLRGISTYDFMKPLWDGVLTEKAHALFALPSQD
ncbi:MAG: hypothetical protein ACTS73_10020 [Arsenophonus sp. NEOnobi-MAG3]